MSAGGKVKEKESVVYLKITLTMFIWGGTFVAAKSISHDVHPVTATFLRFAIASLVMLILILAREKRLPRLTRRDFPVMLLLGMTGVAAYNIFFFLGLQTVDAGRASLIVATNPVFLSLFSALIFREYLARVNVFGIILSVSGALLLISRGDFSQLFHGAMGHGELFIFGCVVTWVTYSLVGKYAMNSLSPLHSVFYSAVFGAGLLLIPALHFGLAVAMVKLSLFQWSMLSYLGIFATVMGFIWYYDGIRKLGVSRAGIFINLVPVSAYILSISIYHEKVYFITGISALAVIGGVFLTNYRKVKN